MYPNIALSPSLSIPTYYLFIILACCLALLLIPSRAAKYQLPVKACLDLCLIVMISGFFGARIFHIFFEEPRFYLENPVRSFQFWNGGFVYYGGFIGAAIAAGIYLNRKHRKDFYSFLDLSAPLLGMTYAVGRMGCLLAGCCYGKYCDLPWAINQQHPTQAYAALWELIVVVILLGVEAKYKGPTKNRNRIWQAPGQLFFLWIVLHGLGRIVMESYRADFRGPIFLVSISTWISIVLVVTGTTLFLKRRI